MESRRKRAAGSASPRQTGPVLLTLSVSSSEAMPNASDLGFLVQKHPDRAQSFDTAVGPAHVFWPEATAERSTVALLLEVDPVGLVRRSGGHDQFALSEYVNDRPYAASSMLAVALSRVFRTAMAGRCTARPELVDRVLPFEVRLPAVPVRRGAELVQRLFEPLGWTTQATPLVLDPQRPDWGDSPYVDLVLSGRMRVAELLTQLYVLIPVLDDGKHYWVSTDEVDKLLRAGGAWLAGHPERELITRRYLRHSRDLVQTAVGRLAELDDNPPDPAEETDGAEEQPSPPVPAASLAERRKLAVMAALRTEGATSVADVGCGEGVLLRELMTESAFTRVLGVDVSVRALERAARRLQLDRLGDRQRERIQLIQSSLTYRDDRLTDLDAIVLMEVIEHLEPSRLPALVGSVFVHARPTSVVITTPNAEHNVRFASLSEGAFRHPDHRFEWTRDEFRGWADAAADSSGYAVRYEPVGEDDPEVGPPTQLAVFRRAR